MEISIDTQLKLRSWKPDDVVELQRIADNVNVSRYLREVFPSPYTLKDAEEWIRLNVNKLHETQFCIEVDGKPAGGIGIFLQNDIHKYTAELGYWLGEEYWHRGIITRCVQAVTPYFIGKFQLKRIYATTFVGNVASAKALEKSGYVMEGDTEKICV